MQWFWRTRLPAPSAEERRRRAVAVRAVADVFRARARLYLGMRRASGLAVWGLGLARAPCPAPGLGAGRSGGGHPGGRRRSRPIRSASGWSSSSSRHSSCWWPKRGEPAGRDSAPGAGPLCSCSRWRHQVVWPWCGHPPVWHFDEVRPVCWPSSSGGGLPGDAVYVTYPTWQAIRLRAAVRTGLRRCGRHGACCDRPSRRTCASWTGTGGAGKSGFARLRHPLGRKGRRCARTCDAIRCAEGTRSTEAASQTGQAQSPRRCPGRWRPPAGRLPSRPDGSGPRWRRPPPSGWSLSQASQARRPAARCVHGTRGGAAGSDGPDR